MGNKESDKLEQLFVSETKAFNLWAECTGCLAFYETAATLACLCATDRLLPPDSSSTPSTLLAVCRRSGHGAVRFALLSYTGENIPGSASPQGLQTVAPRREQN